MEKNNIKEIIIKIEGQEWEDALNNAFEKANKKVKIDGFREGKAPKDVFLKKYGEESLYMDASDLCLDSAYTKMLEDNKELEVVAQPQIELLKVDHDGLEFKFILTLKPSVKLGKYKNLNIKPEKVEVTKEEIDQTIHEMQHRFAENVVKDGAVADGDVAIIDFEGFKDGVAFEGGKGEDYSLKIGSNTFIPGFEEQLIGMKVNEEKDIELTFPEDYHSEDLKGAKVIFKVKVKEVKEIKIPELGKDFYEDLGMEGVNSLETLEEQVEATIRTKKEMDSENEYIESLLETVAKEVEVDIPDVMIKEEVDRILRQYEENLKMQGLTLDIFYQYTNSDEAALREQMTEEANKRVTYRLMLEQIAKEEKIEITPETAEVEASELAKKYNMEKEEFLEAFGGVEMIKYDLMMRQALNIIKGDK
ncbi:MAG: trigger factor [Bacilli bacterium]|nr:trigger factor [Bacilli bacterium]MDD4808739.1 trigger factor [Bacilli bacterium]